MPAIVVIISTFRVIVGLIDGARDGCCVLGTALGVIVGLIDGARDGCCVLGTALGDTLGVILGHDSYNE